MFVCAQINMLDRVTHKRSFGTTIIIKLIHTEKKKKLNLHTRVNVFHDFINNRTRPIDVRTIQYRKVVFNSNSARRISRQTTISISFARPPVCYAEDYKRRVSSRPRRYGRCFHLALRYGRKRSKYFCRTRSSDRVLNPSTRPLKDEKSRDGREKVYVRRGESKQQ